MKRSGASPLKRSVSDLGSPRPKKKIALSHTQRSLSANFNAQSSCSDKELHQDIALDPYSFDMPEQRDSSPPIPAPSRSTSRTDLPIQVPSDASISAYGLSTECESSDAKKKEFSVSEFSGENREQLDEVAYLLGGLASTESLLVQRSSALKLLQLIQNPKTCFLIRANNGFQQIFQLFTESDDEILSLAAALIAVSVCRDTANGSHLSRYCSQMLIHMLCPQASHSNWSKESKPSSALRRKPRGKTAEICAVDLWAVAHADVRWDLPQELSTSFLAAHSLSNASRDELFARLLAEHPLAANIICSLIRSDIEILREHWSPNSSNSEETSNKLNVFQGTSRRLQMLLNVLENVAHHCTPQQLSVITLSSASISSASSIVKILMDLVSLCFTTLPRALLIHELVAAVTSCFLSVLRLLVNLSNGNDKGIEEINRYITQDGLGLELRGISLILNSMALFQTRSALRPQLNDVLSLSCGLLINLAERSPLSRNFIRDSRVWASDFDFEEGKRSFLVSCPCILLSTFVPEQISAPDFFARAFAWSLVHCDVNSALAKAVSDMDDEDNEAKVMQYRAICSYSALLLGLLLTDLTPPREASLPLPPFLSHIPGGPGTLAKELKEFLVLQSDANMLTQDALEVLDDAGSLVFTNFFGCSAVGIIEKIDKWANYFSRFTESGFESDSKRNA